MNGFKSEDGADCSWSVHSTFSVTLGDGWWIGAEVGGDMARILESPNRS